MATYTTNLGLKKPAQSDKIRIADINNNMDDIDAAFGAVGETPVATQLGDIRGGMAIVSNGNAHDAIAAGQFVYVMGHDTLDDGLYTADSALAANATLSSSNLTAVSGGGLNALNSKFANLGTELWTNSSPTSDFSDGDISISNITNWHVVLIQFTENKSATEQYSMTTVVKVGMKGELVFPTSSGILFRTFVTYTNQNKIYFGQGGKSGVGYDNQYCVPIKVVGIA